MSLLIFLHYIIICILLILGIFVFHKYKKTSGQFFLLFCIFYGLWYFLYTVVYSSAFSEEIILWIIRTMYALSLIGGYNMLFFVLFFNQNNIKMKNIYMYIYSVFILGFISIIFTPLFIQNVTYISSQNYYLESYGILYPLLAIVYLLFLPSFIGVSIVKIKKLILINKMRLKYICIGFIIFAFLSELFLVIFPLFGKFYFVETVILFILPFLFTTFYSIYTFNFSNIKVKIGKLFIFILSAFWSIFIINLIKSFYLNLGADFMKLWGGTHHYGVVDFLGSIILFLGFNKFFTSILLGNIETQPFGQYFNILKRKITFITHLPDLNQYLQKEFNHIFKIQYSQLYLLNKHNSNQSELCKFFKTSLHNGFFINDLVFIEENKNKFNLKNIQTELSEESYIIFPLYNNSNEIVAFLSLGKKPFHDTYYAEDITFLKDLSYFLEGHLQYIKTYKKAFDLSVNLDKKVDEQTIEYNQLINKQKEFINYVSHEIKGPITSSIFQIDSIIDEVQDDELSKKGLLKELGILNDLLIKTGELANKLFSIQQFDLNTKSLFKEKVHLVKLLQHEVNLFSKVHTGVKFQTDFDDSIQYIQIDRVQFKQVIDNLINNAIKVIDAQNGIIYVSCQKQNKKVIIEIEDNGQGFSNLDINKIFDKYSTGKGSSVGLGMGLYLCKTIVELHGGNIQAAFGKRLGGAKIIIKIPLI